MGRGDLCGLIGSLVLGARGIAVGKGLVLYGWPIVHLTPGSSIVLGDNVVLTSRPCYTALGVKHPVILRTLSTSANIRIGSNVGMSGTTICAVEAVEIGDECLIGADVTIADTDFHPIIPHGRRFAPLAAAAHSSIVIEQNVFLGAGSYVLKGVRIGENSVIGCASVVTRDIPANCIAAGNPCRVIRAL